MDLIPQAVQVVCDETLCKNWIPSIIQKDYKAVVAESVGRSDTDKGRTLKESHTYEKRRPTKMQQASHNQTTNKILSHFYQLI
jgi:hypothetical protein